MLLDSTDSVSYRVEWTIGGIANDGQDSSIQKVLEDAPGGGSFADPVSGGRLAIFSNGVFEADGHDSFRRENTTTIVRPPARPPTNVTIWTPDTYVEVPDIGASRGTLYRIMLLQPINQLAAHAKGLGTYEEDRATQSYVTMLRYVAQLLTGLPDVRSRPQTDDLIEFVSLSFGLTAIIDVKKQRMVSATLTTPEDGGTFVRKIEYGGWYGAEAIGFSHPGWERVDASRSNDQHQPTVTLYKLPVRTHDVDPRRFSWKPIAKSVFVENERSVLNADGTLEPQTAMQAMPNPVPIGDSVEVTSKGLLRPKHPTTPNRYVWAVGVTLIAFGAALWTRNRFMARK